MTDEVPTAARRPTIRDVAVAAGVSKSLVSMVFRSDKGVSPARRKLIMSTADALGFRPNWLAQSLAADDGNFVGILVADTHNPLFAEIVDAARLELEKAGQFGLLTSAVLPGENGEYRLDARALAAFADLRPRSVLVVGTIPELEDFGRIARGVPFVVASAVADFLPTAMSVRPDETVGMRLVVDHLVAQGHRRIAYIGGAGGAVGVERARAFDKAIGSHGIALMTKTVISDFTQESGFRAAAELFAAGELPTAIAAANDLVAVAVISAAEQRGLDLPRDLAVTGYDNTFIAAIPRISLTSVDPGNAEIGRMAARLLIAPQTDSVARAVLVPPTLVVRGSTAAA